MNQHYGPHIFYLLCPMDTRAHGVAVSVGEPQSELRQFADRRGIGTPSNPLRRPTVLLVIAMICIILLQFPRPVGGIAAAAPEL